MENDVKKREEEVVLQSIEVQMKTSEELLGEVQAILSIMAANSQDAQEPEYGGASWASFLQSELRRLGLLAPEQLERIEVQEELISTAEDNVRTWIEVTTACLEQRSPELARKFSSSGHFGFGGRLALQPYTLRERLVNLKTEIRKRRRRLRSIYEQIKKVGLPVTAPETPPTEDEAGKKPGLMDTKLDALLAGQTGIREDLSGLRQAVLTRFDTSEQTIIATVIERLDQGQLATVQAVLDAIEAGLVPIGELEETLVAVQHTLSEIQQQEVALPDSILTSEEFEHLSEVVDAPKLDVKHKLKVTVPIIPVILSYEGEVELKSGLNLEAAWKRLVAKIRDT